MSKEANYDQGAEPANRALIITRMFNAPRELVFDAFINPKHLMNWWGPRGCTVVSCETDPREGGTWRISMRSPRALARFVHRYPIDSESPGERQVSQSGDVAEHEAEWIVERQRGVYQEVVKPERLVFTYAFEDAQSQPLHKTVVTLTFKEVGARTALTLRHAIFESVSARDDHARGWTEALERLVEFMTQTH